MKLPTNANHVKVPLSALRITGNVRKNFDPEDIERLARSIRQDGLMNPITVRPPVEDENGNKTYEVIAGGRRIRALQLLCAQGDDFAMVECCVRTGDTWTLQMIENIQRTDLSPREKEEAVAQAMENGMTMTQIAEKLCKPISYVSDIVAGMKVRKEADQAGIDTDTISTKALSQLRSIPEESRADAITELAESGGTFREATRVLHEYKKPVIDDVGSAFDDDTSNVSSTNRPQPTARFAPGTTISHIGDRLFFDDLVVGMEFVHGDEKSALYRKVCKITSKDDEDIVYTDGSKSFGGIFSTSKKYIDSQISEHDDWLYAIPADAYGESTDPFDDVIDEFESDDPFDIEPKFAEETAATPSANHPEPFNWYVKDKQTMQSALLGLTQKIRKMPMGTEICVQAGNKIAAISSVVYNPDENRIIFRCLEDFGVRF